MKNAFLIFLLLSFVSQIKSQNYDPMAIEDAHWIIYAIDDSGAAHHAYSIDGDTMIGGLHYKKMYYKLLKNDVTDFEEFEPPYLIETETLIGVIRDDLPNKKVYYQSFTNPLLGYDTCDVFKDILLYDFSVAVGDTITGCLQHNPFTTNVVDTIFSEFLFGKDRTSYLGKHSSIAMTEAIGTGLGPFWIIYALPHPAKPTALVDYCVGKPEVCGLLFTPTNEIRNDWNIKLYPNPTTELLNIEIPALVPHPFHFSIHSATGETVYEKKGTITDAKIEINTSLFPNGIFLIRIQTNEGLAVRRFVKI